MTNLREIKHTLRAHGLKVKPSEGNTKLVIEVAASSSSALRNACIKVIKNYVKTRGRDAQSTLNGQFNWDAATLKAVKVSNDEDMEMYNLVIPLNEPLKFNADLSNVRITLGDPISAFIDALQGTDGTPFEGYIQHGEKKYLMGDGDDYGAVSLTPDKMSIKVWVRWLGADYEIDGKSKMLAKTNG